MSIVSTYNIDNIVSIDNTHNIVKNCNEPFILLIFPFLEEVTNTHKSKRENTLINIALFLFQRNGFIDMAGHNCTDMSGRPPLNLPD